MFEEINIKKNNNKKEIRKTHYAHGIHRHVNGGIVLFKRQNWDVKMQLVEV